MQTDHSKMFPVNGPFSRVSKQQRKYINLITEKISKGIYDTMNVSCLCGSNEGLLLAEKDRYGMFIDTYLCDQCGIIRTTPQLTPKSLTEFYEHEYRKIYSASKRGIDKHFEKQKEHGQQVLQFLKEFTNIDSNTTVYDLGCGSGGTLVPFSIGGLEVRGYDPDKEYVQYGKQKGLNITSNKKEFFHSKQKADIIILSHVLEHYINPIQELDYIKDLIVDQGIFYVEVPGIFSIHKNYGHFMFSLQQAHVWNFTLSTLKNALGSVGFDLLGGSEAICAVFKKSDPKKYELKAKEADNILEYIITNTIG